MSAKTQGAQCHRLRSEGLETLPAARHPAKFTPTVLEAIAAMIPKGVRVLDPFAGTGRIHELDAETVGIELEPEWARLHPDTQVGSALDLPFPDASFDVVATSPTYGNRFADHHNAKDPSKRRSYTHDLGRALHAENSGAMHWGPKYRAFHERAWTEARRVLKPGGQLILNISNHIRGGVEQPVTEWHTEAIQGLGFELEESIRVETPRLRHGQNGAARVDCEFVLAFRRDARRASPAPPKTSLTQTSKLGSIRARSLTPPSPPSSTGSSTPTLCVAGRRAIPPEGTKACGSGAGPPRVSRPAG